jgi:hypothetical protein
MATNEANDDLVTVYTVVNYIEAEIIKSYLISEGIRAFIENENQAAEPGLIALEIKIQVPASEYAQARKLIEAHEIHTQRGDESDDN